MMINNFDKSSPFNKLHLELCFKYVMNKNLHKFKGIAAVDEMYELQGCI